MKKLKRTLSIVFVLITIFSTVAITANAANASTLITKSKAQEKVNTLVSILENKYFTTTGNAVYSNKNNQCYNVNVIKSSWLKSKTGFVPTSYNLMPEHYYSSNGVVTNNAWSCAGFANYALWYIYATKTDDNVLRTNVYTGKFNKSNLDSAKLWPGDVIRIAEKHSVVYLSHDNNGLRVLDSNWNSDNKIKVHTIPYSWNKNSIMACTRGKNFSTAKTTYMLDLNCYLDGVYRGNINGIATADIYINGVKVANDCTDYYKSVKAGSSFVIRDIRTSSGYKYNGSVSISGKINNNVNVNLSFSTKTTYTTTNFKMKSGVYTNAYTSSSLSTKTGRIYPGDIITIKRIYSNGVVQLSCPWNNNGSKIVYAKASELRFKATKYIDAFSSVNGNKVGRVYPNDLVTVISIYNSGWLKCSCPWTGGTNKIIYIKTSAIF